MGHTVISIQMCSNAEHQAIDSIIDKGPVQAGMMDLKVVQGTEISWSNFHELLSENSENCEHLKYFGNVYCVMINHAGEQDT